MTTLTETALPPLASRAEWNAARKALLAQEKELTRMRDRVSAQRRRLPMVRVEKDYVFHGPEGKRSLFELFAGRRQLYVHHFMWMEMHEKHCPGCTAAADTGFDNPRFRQHLAERDVTFVAISRAPLDKILSFKREKGWSFPWYSCAGTDFNHDFHVTLDRDRGPIEYNYRTEDELVEAGFAREDLRGDWPANSVFLRDGDSVYHTYSTYQRGTDHLFLPNAYLDLTPYGRQEAWEDSPAGWPQRPPLG